MAWLTGWNYRLKVTVENEKVSSNLTDFPVYVDLSDLPAGFHTNVKSDGGDIRVTTSDGETEVPREVVWYNATDDEGELHFKGSLTGATDTEFYIYYGNASASNHADNATYGAENVWDSNYKAVHHLEDVTTSTVEDSTSNDNDGTKKAANSPQVVSGKMGDGQDFENGTGYIELGNTGMPNTNQAMTLECWAYYASGTPGTENLVLINNTSSAAVQLGFRGGQVRTWLWGGDTITASALVGSGAWHHYVFTTDGTNHYQYVDGSEANSSTVNLQSGNPTEVRINTEDWDETFDGVIDEARISNVARSADWISTQYNNQSNTGTFFTIGSQEEAGQTITPSAQALTLTQQTPSVITTKSVTVAVTALALAVTLQAPTVTAQKNVTVEPSAQGIVLSQQTPTVATPNTWRIERSTDGGEWVVLEEAIQINPNGSFVYDDEDGLENGKEYCYRVKNVFDDSEWSNTDCETYSVGIIVTPSALGLVLSQETPTVTATKNPTITPSALGLSLTQLEPDIDHDKNITTHPAVQALNLSQQTPTVTGTKSITVEPIAQGLELTQQTPSVTTTKSITVEPSAQALALTQQTPVVVATKSVTVELSAQALALAQQIPTAVEQKNIVVDLDDPDIEGIQRLGIALQEPIVTAEKNIIVSPATQALVLNQQTPNITATKSVIVEPTSQALVTAQQVPTVIAVKNITIEPTAQALALALQTPTITGTKSVVVQPSVQALVLAQQAPVIQTTTGVTVMPSALNLALTQNSPTIDIVSITKVSHLMMMGMD